MQKNNFQKFYKTKPISILNQEKLRLKSLKTTGFLLRWITKIWIRWVVFDLQNYYKFMMKRLQQFGGTVRLAVKNTASECIRRASNLILKINLPTIQIGNQFHTMFCCEEEAFLKCKAKIYLLLDSLKRLWSLLVQLWPEYILPLWITINFKFKTEL